MLFRQTGFPGYLKDDPKFSFSILINRDVLINIVVGII